MSETCMHCIIAKCSGLTSKGNTGLDMKSAHLLLLNTRTQGYCTGRYPDGTEYIKVTIDTYYPEISLKARFWGISINVLVGVNFKVKSIDL